MKNIVPILSVATLSLLIAGCIGENSLKLEGTPWVLESYVNDEGTLVNVLSGTEVTADFHGGTIRGSGGCNSYSGGYTVDDNALTIGTLSVNLKFCTKPGIMDQETAYLSALRTAATYTTTGSTLEIRDASKKLILKFVKK